MSSSKENIMSSGLYDCFKEDLFGGTVDLDSDTIKCALLTSSHSFTQTNTTWANVSANEISGTGYTAGGVELSSKTISVSSGVARWDAADATWLTSTFTARHAVLYDTTNSSSLIASIDFGGDQTISVGTFTVQWSTGGIMALT